MRFIDDRTLPLPLIGGVIQEQRLVVPLAVIKGLKTYRHACRLAWRLRVVRNLTMESLAQQAGLYKSHTSNYFSAQENRRELPARKVVPVERVLGNKVITQWLVHQGGGVLLEELMAHRSLAADGQREAA